MKFEIPFPCSQDIDKMNPQDNGRFCDACTKVVVDFREMSLKEIQNYFHNHKNESICGTFNSKSIEDQQFAIPLEIIQSNYDRWIHLFILAFMVAFGFLSFGCNEVDTGAINNKVPQTTLGMSMPPNPEYIDSGTGKVGMIYTKTTVKVKPPQFCSPKEIENRIKTSVITNGMPVIVVPSLDEINLTQPKDIQNQIPKIDSPEIIMGKPMKGKIRITKDSI